MKAGFSGPKNWPCCGVTAVATACEIPFASVLEYMRKRWGLTQGWKGATHAHQRNDALTHFGATFTEHKFRRVTSDRRIKFWKWALLNAKHDVTYIVNVPGHVVVFRNGDIIDQFYSTPTFFAHSDRVANSCINSVTEIHSIPSAESRQDALKASADDLSSIF